MWIWFGLLAIAASAVIYYYFYVLLPKQERATNASGDEGVPEPDGDIKVVHSKPLAPLVRYVAHDGARWVEVRGDCASAGEPCRHWSRTEADPADGVERDHAGLTALMDERAIKATPFQAQ